MGGIRVKSVLDSTEPVNNKQGRILLLLTFDIDTGADSIILKKILSCLQDTKDYLL